MSYRHVLLRLLWGPESEARHSPSPQANACHISGGQPWSWQWCSARSRTPRLPPMLALLRVLCPRRARRLRARRLLGQTQSGGFGSGDSGCCCCCSRRRCALPLCQPRLVQNTGLNALAQSRFLHPGLGFLSPDSYGVSLLDLPHKAQTNIGQNWIDTFSAANRMTQCVRVPAAPPWGRDTYVVPKKDHIFYEIKVKKGNFGPNQLLGSKWATPGSTPTVNWCQQSSSH